MYTFSQSVVFGLYVKVHASFHPPKTTQSYEQSYENKMNNNWNRGRESDGGNDHVLKCKHKTQVCH